MTKSHKKELLFVAFGILALITWITLFTIGLLINSSYYRSALSFGYWEWKDLTWAIISFTLSNVALLAFFSGFAGGICSKIIATEGFTLTKDELKAKGVDYVLFENPFISAFRGVFLFLAVLSLQYLSSFTDIASINNGNSKVKSDEGMQNNKFYQSILNSVKDTTSKNQIMQAWDAEEKKVKPNDMDSIARKIIYYKDSIHILESFKTNNNALAIQQTKNKLKDKIRKLRSEIKVDPISDIPGISATSYFKFAIIVSLLAFICGYDPGRFNSILAKIPILSKKESENKKIE